MSVKLPLKNFKRKKEIQIPPPPKKKYNINLNTFLHKTDAFFSPCLKKDT